MRTTPLWEIAPRAAGRKRQGHKSRRRREYPSWAMSDVKPPDYGAEIRRLRLERQWGRDRLAEEAGVASADVERAEFGALEHLVPILAALGVESLTLVVPQVTADYLRTVRPIASRIPPEKLPIALAECLRILARAAAGIDEPATDVRQYNVVSGDADIAQTVH